MRGTVVEVYIPAVVTAPAIMSQRDRFEGVKICQAGIGRHFPINYRWIGVPVAVASPGIPAAMITGLQHRVKDIAILNQMTTPATIAQIDSRTGDIINRAATNGDTACHGDLDAGCLLLHSPGVADKAIIDQAIGGIVLRAGTGSSIELGVIERLIVIQKMMLLK